MPALLSVTEFLEQRTPTQSRAHHQSQIAAKVFQIRSRSLILSRLYFPIHSRGFFSVERAAWHFRHPLTSVFQQPNELDSKARQWVPFLQEHASFSSLLLLLLFGNPFTVYKPPCPSVSELRLFRSHVHNSGYSTIHVALSFKPFSIDKCFG